MMRHHLASYTRAPRPSPLYLAVVLFLLIGWTTAFSQTNSVSYSSTSDIFLNPERGLFQGLEATPEGTPLALSDLQSYRSQGKSIIERAWYLDSFTNRLLSTTELNLISNDFNTMRQAGVKCIVRFAYTHYESDPNHPDAPLDTILLHLGQLTPILQANSDVILVMQAGFIGAWGEWHHSTHGLDASNSAKQTLINKELSILPANRMVQMRYCQNFIDVFGTNFPGDTLTASQGYNGTNIARVGLHDDAFVGTWDDAGTYHLAGSGALSDSAKTKPWLSRQARYVMTGGETDRTDSRDNCTDFPAELARMKYTFLNANFYGPVISALTTAGCWTTTITRNLGYRFSLVNAALLGAVSPGNGFTIQFQVANTGYAPLYNPRNVEVIARNAADPTKVYTAQLAVDPRQWTPGTTKTVSATIGVPSTMPTGTYTLLLNLPDPESRLHARPEYSIRLANVNVWEASSGYNNLLSSLNVTTTQSGSTYTGTLFFQPLAGGGGSGSGGAAIPPSAPVLASPVNGAVNQPLSPTLSWNASSGAASYRLQVSANSAFTSLVLDDSTLTTTSRSAGTLAAGTAYYWRVSAKNSAGSSGFSIPWSFTTLVNPPSASTLTASSVTTGGALLNGSVNPNGASTTAWFEWGTSSTLSTPASTASQAIGSGTGAVGISAALSGLTPSTVYYYRTVAQNGGGTQRGSILSLTTANLVVVVSAPPPPLPSSPTDGATNEPTAVMLSWTASSGATTYEVQVSTDSTFAQFLLDDSTLTTTSRQASGLSGATKYFWRVKAKNSGGSSAYSSTERFSTAAMPPAAPTILSPAAGTTKQSIVPTVSWSAPTGALTYRLQVSTDPNFSVMAFDDAAQTVSDSVLAQTSRQVGPLAYHTVYYCRVRGENGSGPGAYSAVSSFSTAVNAKSKWQLSIIANGANGDAGSAAVPGEFALYQNSPNPFNPTTTIRYDLAAKSNVVLTLYNLLGQEVMTLVDGFQEAGHYEVRLDAGNLASGIYLYRIRAGEFLATRRLLLLK